MSFDFLCNGFNSLSLKKNSTLRRNHKFTYVFTTVLYWSNSSRNCLWSAKFIRSSPYKSSQSSRKFVPWDPSCYTQTEEWTDMTKLTKLLSEKQTNDMFVGETAFLYFQRSKTI